MLFHPPLAATFLLPFHTPTSSLFSFRGSLGPISYQPSSVTLEPLPSASQMSGDSCWACPSIHLETVGPLSGAANQKSCHQVAFPGGSVV